MFTVNEDLSIYATRGDIVFFEVSADDNGTPYHFQPGDIVRMAIYGRKDAEKHTREIQKSVLCFFTQLHRPFPKVSLFRSCFLQIPLTARPFSTEEVPSFL